MAGTGTSVKKNYISPKTKIVIFLNQHDVITASDNDILMVGDNGSWDTGFIGGTD